MHLEVKGLSKEYKRDNRSFSAVKNVSLEVFNCDFISIVGHSGSGKSTLLNLIAGLLLPTSGEILIDGDNAASWSDKKASLLRNTLIGYVPQGQSLLSNLTVFDNVRLPFYLSKQKGNPDDAARELLYSLGIEALADCYPSSLSGGEMRRAAIARALVNKPSLLLADEPTSDLDADNTDEIISLFRRISKEETTVIMVTHDLHTVKGADRSYIMNEGNLLHRQDPAERFI